MRKGKAIITAFLAAAIMLIAIPAMAHETGPDESGQERLEQRLDRACARVPRITERVQNALDRIQGDADTVGSLLWLEERVDLATERGHDDAASWFESRIAIRTEMIDVLELRLEWLAEAAERCAAR